MIINKTVFSNFFYLILILWSNQLFSQIELAEKKLKKEESIIYFDKDWNIIPSKYNAEYYRIFKIGIDNSSKGIIKDYYKSGEVQAIIEKALYVDFQDLNKWIYDGFEKQYYRTGKIADECFHFKGVINGPRKQYYESGGIRKIEIYQNGERTKFDLFYESGKKWASGALKNNKPQGLFIEYYESGEVWRKSIYDEGKEVSMSSYFKNGKLNVKSTKDSKIIYDKFGKILLDEKKENYEINLWDVGVYTENLDEANYAEIKVYDSGYLNPKTYTSLLIKIEDGCYQYMTRSIEFTEENGEETKNGILEVFYENGITKSKCNYVNGEKHGEETFYDQYGIVTNIFEWNNGVKNNWTKDCSKTPCEYTFISYFNNKEEAENQGWSFNDNDKQKNYITSNAEYYFKNIKNSNFNHINLPINFNENFQASVYADYWNGSQNSWFGIIVGWEDWDNYVDLTITPNGYYQANIIKDGINFGMQDYKKLEGKTFYDWVKLNIVKSNGKLVFTINKKIVYISEFSKIIGEKCGLYNSGIKSVQFDDFKVTKYKANQTSKPKPDYSSKNQWAGNGSGIIISKNGLIATNNHVIKGSSEIEVEFLYNNEIKSFKAKVVKTDPTNDLAIIKIDDNAFTGLSNIRYNFKTRSSQVGESVFALGYPKALSLMGKEMKFTDGKISSKTGFQGDVTTYQTTTPIQPGNSGGPLFDYNGNFIGINSSKIVQDDVDNVSYSIKSLYLLTLIDALAESVELPSDNSISSLPLTTKIKKLEKYVTLIKVR